MDNNAKAKTLAVIEEWKNFITLTEGFSLEKEVEDGAAKVKQLTLELGNLLQSSSAFSLMEELYADTEVSLNTPLDHSLPTSPVFQPTSPANVPEEEDAVYELEADTSPSAATGTATSAQETSKTLVKKGSKGSGKKEKKDNDSVKSGGSAKDDTVADVSWESIKPSAFITGKLTAPGSGGFFKSNPKVLIAVNDSYFYIFEKESSKKQKQAFHLAGYECTPVGNDKSKKNKAKEFIFTMEARGKATYTFSVHTQEALDKWVNELNNQAKKATAEPGQANQDTTADGVDDMYDDPAGIASTETVEEVDAADDIYEDTDNMARGDAAPPPPLPQRDVADEPPPPVMLRQKSKKSNGPPPAAPESEIYDDGTTLMPPPPTSWIDDDICDGSVPTIPGKSTQSTTAGISLNMIQSQFYAMWDCTGTTEQELSFTNGEIIEVLDKRYDSEGWWIGLLKGRPGLVPKNYLSPVYRKV